MSLKTDVLILGGGTGGYVAAIKAAQEGLDVIIVEKEKLGGTCLHKGCIPTKALLRSAEMVDSMHNALEFGIENDHPFVINFAKVQSRKETIVNQLYQGIQGLMKKNKIKVLYGHGVVMGPSIFSPVSGAVIVDLGNDEEEVIIPKHLIIATGSKPRTVPNLPLDEEYILSSDGMLELKELPKKIAIIGGGVIGSEWASLLNSFGVEVTIIEFEDQLLPTEGKNIAKAFHKAFEQKGITIKTSSEVEAVEVKDNQVLLSIKGEDSMIVDKVMVAVGREPNIHNIGLMNTSVKFNEKGIEVNESYQTAESHIYAIGDCIPTLQLAHVASKEGELAVAHILKEEVEPLSYIDIPRCTYASPEVASVGYHQNNLPEGTKAKIGTFPFTGNGKALIHGDTVGFVEVIRDEETDDLLGVSIIGPHATDLISEVSTAKYLDATPREIGEAVHAHPTLSEAIMEAALDTYNAAIHK